MAHNLTENNGKYEFAYTGESPWHGLGQRLPAIATKDDIMRAAGLEWTVVGEPLYLAEPGGGWTPVPGFVANVRSDTRGALGVVSTDYRVVQNGDATCRGCLRECNCRLEDPCVCGPYCPQCEKILRGSGRVPGTPTRGVRA